MSNFMHYKGYYASVEYSDEDRVFFGKVEGIRSLISFEGSTVEELKKGFHEAVGDYLETCKQQGLEPEKPFKGSFNVRIGPELHRALYIEAKEEDMTINEKVNKILSSALGVSRKRPVAKRRLKTL